MATLGRAIDEARGLLMAYGAELARACGELRLEGCDVSVDLSDADAPTATFRGYAGDELPLHLRVSLPPTEVVRP